MTICIRHYRPGDHVGVAEAFTRAIHEIACESYTAEQCAAWADRRPNPEHWRRRCERKRPFIAEVEGHVAGFVELDPDGHLDCLYVSPDFARRGVATALVRHAVDRAWYAGAARMYVEASHCLRPLLEREGFVVVAEQSVDVRGVALTNFRMELRRPEGVA